MGSEFQAQILNELYPRISYWWSTGTGNNVMESLVRTEVFLRKPLKDDFLSPLDDFLTQPKYAWYWLCHILKFLQL